MTEPKESPGAAAGTGTGVVVVGIDGSPPSSRALAAAADEARWRKARLRVVGAWSFPAFAAGAYVPAGAYEDVPAALDAAVAAQVAEVLGPQPDVQVERVTGEGPAASFILDAAKDADLVVVGSRGRGGFAGLLLGSVSSQVVHHAHCPVLVVRT
ncbi:MAG: universal stress protein [Actinomycetota bacterium]|nr:universal stress protein [Actinomycetota bacterium]